MTPSWERTRSPANILPVLHHLYEEDFPYEKMVRPLDLQQHFDLLQSPNIRRRPFVSKLGYLGLRPIDIKPGDQVVMLCGVQVLFTVRAKANGRWGLVRDTYVHGNIDGLQDASMHTVKAIDIT